jgi:pimeloyl-ACP methyl ester carboxylesterase
VSLFDEPDFNGRLFYPRAGRSPVPPGAYDRDLTVPGAKVHLRIHAPAGTLATVVLFHGNGEVVGEYDDLADPFASVGLRLAISDYRGYGRSTGRPTLRDALSDAVTVLGAVKAEVQGPLLLLGRSLGSAPAIHLASLNDPRVVGLVIDSGFSRLEGLVSRRGLMGEITAQDRLDFDPLPKMARVQAPVVVIHGERDDLIIPEEGRELAAAARGRFVGVPGAGHNDLFGMRGYWSVLGDFVRELCGGR